MKRILFVDDEPRLLENLQNVLRCYRSQWDMTFAPGGLAALQLLETQSFDVIVSDMRMPRVDGTALLTWVQREHPRTVRIVLSGQAELQATLKALPVAHQFLSKPCDAAELKNVIERACQIQALVGDPKIQQIVGGINQLPALPRVYQQLMQALAEDRTHARDVAVLLQQDMTLCAKLLQIVNSAFFRLTRRITKIEEAVNYLGFIMVRDLALTIELFTANRQSGFSFGALQQHALRVASLARQITADPRSADDAFMAGMLHDIGKLVLALRIPDPYRQALHLARQRPLLPRWQTEQEVLGVSHAEVGAYLLGLWGLPYPIIEAVAFHHQPRTVPPYEFDALAAVYVANGLVHELSPAAMSLPLESLDSDYLTALGVFDRLVDWRTLARAQNAALNQE